jgi:hypothetical protein
MEAFFFEIVEEVNCDLLCRPLAESFKQLQRSELSLALPTVQKYYFFVVFDLKAYEERWNFTCTS